VARETLEQAVARADSLHRLLWLVVRQVNGKLTIRPGTLLTWDDHAKLRILQDVSNGGITLVADIPKRPVNDHDPEWKLREEGGEHARHRKVAPDRPDAGLGWRVANRTNRSRWSTCEFGTLRPAGARSSNTTNCPRSAPGRSGTAIN
jgi:hypothetical protein